MDEVGVEEEEERLENLPPLERARKYGLIPDETEELITKDNTIDPQEKPITVALTKAEQKRRENYPASVGEISGQDRLVWNVTTANREEVGIRHDPLQFIRKSAPQMREIGSSLKEASRKHLELLKEMLHHLNDRKTEPLTRVGMPFDSSKEAQPYFGALHPEDQAVFALAADLVRREGSVMIMHEEKRRNGEDSVYEKDLDVYDTGLRFESDAGKVGLVVRTSTEISEGEENLSRRKVQIGYLPDQDINTIRARQRQRALQGEEKPTVVESIKNWDRVLKEKSKRRERIRDRERDFRNKKRKERGGLFKAEIRTQEVGAD